MNTDGKKKVGCARFKGLLVFVWFGLGWVVREVFGVMSGE